MQYTFENDSLSSTMSFEYLNSDSSQSEHSRMCEYKALSDPISNINTKILPYKDSSDSSVDEKDSTQSFTSNISSNVSYDSNDMSFSSVTTHSSYSTYNNSIWSLDSLAKEDLGEDWEFLIDDQKPTFSNQTNTHLKNPEERQVSLSSSPSSKYTRDTIGSFNINRQYSHECSAELMLKANLSLLTLQEPFGSFTTNNDSWKSYRISNLNSAFLKAFESKHQILILDEEKWGGKNLEDIQCYQEGRILAIPFQLSRHQIMGVISIYAITSGEATLANGSSKKKIRTKTTEMVREISDKWEMKYPGIEIIIIGDLQETWSTSNLDNLGNYRKDLDENGIIQEFKDSHYSIVRLERENSQQHYWTRQGRLGSRGIDHILIPRKTNGNIWDFTGHMEKELGKLFYNSDHCLLTSTFTRWEENEDIQCDSKIHFRYEEISSIPLRTSGTFNQESDFDDKKFKNDKLRKQKLLYDKIQKLTGPNSQFSKDLKPKLDLAINQLIDRLWTRSVKLGKTGKNNNLLKMNEKDGALLENISIKYKAAIRDMMISLELDSEVNNTKSKNTNRNNIKKSGCTKPFNTLPISSKLRLAIKTVNRTIQRLKNIQQDIDLETNIRTTLRDHSPPTNLVPVMSNTPSTNKTTPPLRKHKKDKTPNIERKIINLLNFKTIDNRINKIATELNTEYEEWFRHTEAIKHLRKNGDLATDKTYGHTLHSKGGDSLLHAEPEDIDDLNKLFNEIDPKQPFIHNEQDYNIKSSNPYSITKNLQDWKNDLRKCTNWAGYLNTADDIQITNMTKAIKDALKNLRKIRRRLSWKQRTYKHDKVNYFCETNKMSAFTNILKPKAREAPAVHDIIYDRKENRYRHCINIKEQLTATKDYHDNWMKPSKAKKSCFFVDLIKEGSLGIRGIKNFPNRKFTRENVKEVVIAHESLSEDMIQKIIKAHGPHTAEEFAPPKLHNKEL